MKNYNKITSPVSLLIIAITCIIFLSPAAGDAGEVYPLTSEYLVSGTWGPEYEAGMKIKFSGDGYFESETVHGRGRCSADGTYTIKSGKLNLFMKNSKAEGFCGVMTLKDGVLCTDAASLKYRRYILFRKKEVKGLYFHEDLKIWDYKSRVLEGEPVTVKGVKAAAMGTKKAVTTTAVKVRKTPDINGREIHFSYTDKETHGTINAKAIPENYTVLVLARTNKMDTVGIWNNYWYYVEYNNNSCGWVYGKFIKIE